MTVEHKRTISERPHGIAEDLWTQVNLRDEIEKLHGASDRPSLIKHASLVCAHLSLVPKDYHPEIEIVPRLLQGFDREILKFSKKDIHTTATRTYLQVGVYLGNSQLTFGLSVEDSRPAFILQEITGQTFGVVRKIAVKNLISARIIRNLSTPNLKVI